MPTFAAPGFLLAALAGVAVVVGVHLLAWRRPTPRVLPTARFAPPSAARNVSRAVKLSDVALLAVRALALLLTGLAMARPAIAPRRGGVARVLVLDASRRVGNLADVVDSARMLARGADHVVRIRVDSVARLLPDSALGPVAAVRGHLGAGLVAAVREAKRLTSRYARVELVVVSPFAAESWDVSMDAVRGRWSGTVRTVRVAGEGGRGASPSPSEPSRATASGQSLPPARDPVGAAAALALGSANTPLRLLRAPLTAGDSVFAREGGLVIEWPDETLADSSFAPRTLVAGEHATIARLAPGTTSLAGGRIVVRWGDGTPAAVEHAMGGGCVRRVNVVVPRAGDATLRPAVLAVVRELAAPCGGGSARLVDDARLASWARGAGIVAPDDIAAADSGAPGRTSQRWLLLAVAALLAVEWWMRRQRAVHDVAPSARDDARVAA